MPRQDLPPLHLCRIDPSRNMRRFYGLMLQPTLFGEASLIRTWGRIGSAGRCLIETFAEPEAAIRARAHLEAAKRRKGYGEPQTAPVTASTPAPPGG